MDFFFFFSLSSPSNYFLSHSLLILFFLFFPLFLFFYILNYFSFILCSFSKIASQTFKLFISYNIRTLNPSPRRGATSRSRLAILIRLLIHIMITRQLAQFFIGQRIFRTIFKHFCCASTPWIPVVGQTYTILSGL